jgi:hypothetical protein
MARDRRRRADGRRANHSGREGIMIKRIVVAAAFAASVWVGFGVRTASALPCCSACDEIPNNPACRHGCTPDCRIDDPADDADAVVIDDAARVCYAVGHVADAS